MHRLWHGCLSGEHDVRAMRQADRHRNATEHPGGSCGPTPCNDFHPSRRRMSLPLKAFRHSQWDMSSFRTASGSRPSWIATTSRIWTGRRCASSPPRRCPGSRPKFSRRFARPREFSRRFARPKDFSRRCFARPRNVHTAKSRTVTPAVSIVGPDCPSSAGSATSADGRWRSPPSTAALERRRTSTWPDVEIAFGGSDGSGLADTLVAELGLTGIPFTNVKNGCATGGSALLSAVNAIRSGAAEIALAVGFDKHPRGAFDPRPEDWGLPDGYGEAGLMVTTQFFGIKIARYMREHGITDADPGPGRREGLPQRRAEPRTPGAARRCRPSEIAAAGHGQRPADPLHVLLARARAAPRSSSPAAAVATARRPRRSGCCAAATRTRRFGSFEVFSPCDPGDRRAVERQRRRRRGRLRGGRRRPRRRRRRPAAGHRERRRDHAHGRVRLLRARRAGGVIAAGETEIGGRLPVNTDGGCIANGEPIGASGPAPGPRDRHPAARRGRRPPGPRPPQVGFTHVYGAPGHQRLHGAGACEMTHRRGADDAARLARTGSARTTTNAQTLPDLARSRGRRSRGRASAAADRSRVGIRLRTRSPSSRTGPPRRSARETDRIRAYEQAKYDAGWGALTWPDRVRRPRACPMSYALAFRQRGSGASTCRAAPRCSR